MTTTQNCAECGTRAEPGQSFCDACGAVLSWTDRVAAGASASGGRAEGSGAGTDDFGGDADAVDRNTGAANGSSGAAGRNGNGSVQGGDASGRGSDEAAFAASSAGSASSAGAGGSSTGESGGSGGSGDPGWDAFARSDGSAGLVRSAREELLASGTTATAADAGGAPVATNASTGPSPSTAQPLAPSASPSHPTPSPSPSQAATQSPADPYPTAPPRDDDTLPNEPVSAAAGAIPNPTVFPAAPPPEDPAYHDEMAHRARQLLVPVNDPQPRPTAEPAVAPVLPGRPAPQRPQTVRAPGEELGADGGTPCPWCATRNRPERHYCARCAMPMAGEGPVPGRLPWWRRLLGFRNRETPWAGDRPRLRRAFDRVLTWLTAAVALALLIWLAFSIPKGVQATRDHFAKRAQVAPDSVSASRSYPGHKPALAFDKLNDTWWGPGVSASGRGEWIEAKFEEPTRLLDLLITPGVSARADQLSQSALPHRIEATITLASGKTTKRELTLDQGAGAQRRAFRVGEVTKVRFTIESAYLISSTKQVAIAEIEFFGPSNANSG
ncbi:NADase-type glycan-binding domain-containing protein [Streptomyces sp. NPDC088794]|uniref:NADase-type glycan-binding domain-containing protein n=1 Tax=Streptomyces sp. NPDC088794 TaxID=3365902 RepID=UPI00382406FE